MGIYVIYLYDILISDLPCHTAGQIGLLSPPGKEDQMLAEVTGGAVLLSIVPGLECF